MSYVVKSRKFFTGPITFAIGPWSGAHYPSFDSAIGDLRWDYDLNNQAVTLMMQGSALHQGVSLIGPLPGQYSPDNLIIRGADKNNGVIVPSGGRPGIEMAYGAMCRIEYLTIDQTVNANHQDCIFTAHGSRLKVMSEVRLRQADNGVNFMTSGGASIDILPGDMYIEGHCQCFWSGDHGSNIHWGNNGQPNMNVMHLDPGYQYGIPHWDHSFLNPRGASIATCQVVTFIGTATGNRYKVDKGGCLDVGLDQYPNGIANLPGSQNTAWPVEGFIH